MLTQIEIWYYFCKTQTWISLYWRETISVISVQFKTLPLWWYGRTALPLDILHKISDSGAWMPYNGLNHSVIVIYHSMFAVHILTVNHLDTLTIKKHDSPVHIFLGFCDKRESKPQSNITWLWICKKGQNNNIFSCAVDWEKSHLLPTCTFMFIKQPHSERI